MSKTLPDRVAPAAGHATTAERLGRAVLALAILAGLAVVPVALVRLGLPTVGEVRSAVSLRWMPPELGGHLVAVVGWLLWAYVVAWLAVAVVGEVRGASRSVPRLLRPALVPLVSLVVSVLVRSPGGPQPIMQPASAVSTAPVPPSPAGSPSTQASPRPTAWTVEEGQSLWSIAVSVYGDGEQCLRIAAANPGVDPRDLQVGEVLRLPPTVEAAAGSTQQWRVQPGESLWSIAESVYGDGEQWVRIAEANRGREVAPGEVLSDPSLIEPGWTLEIPAPASPPSPGVTPGPSSTPPAATPPPAPPAASRFGPTPGAPAPVEGGAAHADESVQPGTSTSGNGTAPRRPPADHPLGQASGSVDGSHPPKGTSELLAEVAVSLGLAAVAAGVTATLRLRRRVQQRRRRSGRRITLPPQSLADLEATLSVAKPSTPDLLDAGLRFVTARLREAGFAAPAVLAVRRGEDHLELLLAEAYEQAPPPFRAAGQGSRWRLDVTDADEAALAGVDEIAPCPTLVTVGADDEGAVLLHLEGARFVACGGTGSAPLGGLASMAVELATSAWHNRFELALVDVPARLEGLDSVRHASLDDALAEAEAHSRANAIGLAEHGQRAPSVAALSGELDPPIPFVVVCGRQLTAEEADHVGELTESAHGGVAVVTLGQPATARWLLTYEGERVSVDPLGVSLRSSRLESVELEGVDDLLSTALADDCPPETEPYADHAPVSSTTAGSEVEVRLLGPVEVAGAEQPIARAIGEELVAFLATRERGVTTETWTTALRPEARLSQNYIAHAASAARHGLGRARDSEWHLPPAHGHGRLRLRDTVDSDWARFRRLAKSTDPADWDEALRLVRGEPFAGTGWEWPIRDGLVADMQAEVIDLAVVAGDSALERHDPERAARAAEAGMAICRWDERPYRLMMRALAAQGDLSGVRAVMRRLTQVLEDDVEPFDAVERETRQLFASLTSQDRMAAGG